MRRWTAVRIAGLAVVAVVGAGVLYQLPASPFERGGRPERPVVQTQPVQEPAVPKVAADAQDRPDTRTTSRPPPRDRPDPAITYPQRGTVHFTVLPGDPEHR